MTKPPWLADPGCKSILRVSEVASAGEDRYATEGAVSWSGTISGCMFIYTNKPPLASTSFFDIHYIYIHTYILYHSYPHDDLAQQFELSFSVGDLLNPIINADDPRGPPPKKIYETDSIGMLNLQIFLMTVAAYIFFRPAQGIIDLKPDQFLGGARDRTLAEVHCKIMEWWVYIEVNHRQNGILIARFGMFLIPGSRGERFCDSWLSPQMRQHV